MEFSSSFLGFYMQQQPLQVKPMTSTKPTFVPITNKGIDLKEKRWGDLDESLSFLPYPFQIVASSNGFLLCCTNLTYIICNPVTKEFQTIPPPQKQYNYANIIFICKTDDHNCLTLRGTHYTIIRCGISHPFAPTTVLEVDTFSSDTGQWIKSCFVSPVPLKLHIAGQQCFVLDNLIIWSTYHELVVSDPSKESLEVIQLPAAPRSNYVLRSLHLGKSEGKIHYCRIDNLEIEVWMMEDIQLCDWILRCKVPISEMLEENPHLIDCRDEIFVCQFHPHNSQLILLVFSGEPYWFNCSTKKLTEVVSCERFFTIPCFPYEWPCEPC